jgi:predicted AAA+ superfamily ATPase
MTDRWFARSLAPPRGSFFLLGPRGTGKSSWLRRTFPDAEWVDLLDEALYQSLLADPGLFAARLRSVERGRPVVVDEVQRIPSLLNEVHRFIEDRRLRFALCGSSARKLRRGGTNLLAGRAVLRSMHPLLPQELGDAFRLEEVLRWGSLPVIVTAPNRREALEAYAQTYLREEIQAEALARNLAGFARFLPVAALFHAQVLNAAALARDAGVSRNTVLGYLDILEDTLLGFRLRAYEGRLRVRERRHPKLYWADPGLPRAFKRQLDPPTAEERGALFEGWIAEVLRAHRDYFGLFDDWSYWASGRGSEVEVDFLLSRGKKMVAVEVKASRRLAGRALSGLRAIAELPQVIRRIVVFLGEHRQRTADGIEVLPLGDFLGALETGRLF